MATSPESSRPLRFIWATRGRTWGFRFLRSGGFDDPLLQYEKAFSGLDQNPEACRHVEAGIVALRFADPENRRDAAGRIIPHDFVLLGTWAEKVKSIEQGRGLVWPEVCDEYAEAWAAVVPPTGMA